MVPLGSATFHGKSGQAYKMSVFPFEAVFKPSIGGVYMVTRRTEQPDGKVAHEWLYAGYALDMRSRFEIHPMAYGFKQYRANAICFLAENDPDKQKQIQADLRLKYMPVLNETGYGQIV